MIVLRFNCCFYWSLKLKFVNARYKLVFKDNATLTNFTVVNLRVPQNHPVTSACKPCCEKLSDNALTFKSQISSFLTWEIPFIFNKAVSYPYHPNLIADAVSPVHPLETIDAAQKGNEWPRGYPLPKFLY